MCSHCTLFLKFEILCSQWDFQRGKSYFSYYTLCSLRADTMSNRSASHRTPTLCFKKIYLLNIVWICFFYKWKQDSCHLHQKHRPQNALIIPQSLTYSFHRLAKPCLQLRGASTRVLLKHFKLYITKTTHFSFKSVYFLLYWKNTILGSRICLQVSAGPSAIALGSFPSLLPFCYCIDPGSSPCYLFLMIGITFLPIQCLLYMVPF